MGGAYICFGSERDWCEISPLDLRNSDSRIDWYELSPLDWRKIYCLNSEIDLYEISHFDWRKIYCLHSGICWYGISPLFWIRNCDLINTQTYHIHSYNQSWSYPRPMNIMAKSPNLVDSTYHGVYTNSGVCTHSRLVEHGTQHNTAGSVSSTSVSTHCVFGTPHVGDSTYCIYWPR